VFSQFFLLKNFVLYNYNKLYKHKTANFVPNKITKLTLVCLVEKLILSCHNNVTKLATLIALTLNFVFDL